MKKLDINPETLEALSKDELIDYILNYCSSARAKVGEGTQAGKKLTKLTKNHLLILKFFDDTRLQGRRMWSIRELRDELYQRRIWRYDHHDKYVCCYWDYHHLQATCSVLVGAGFLSMTSHEYSGFEENTGNFVVRPRPQYFASFEQSKRFREINKRGYPYRIR